MPGISVEPTLGGKIGLKVMVDPALTGVGLLEVPQATGPSIGT